MQAVGIHKYALDLNQSLQAVEVPKPVPTGRDILVRNYSVATNPVDVKKLTNHGNVTDAKFEQPLIAGYDSAGVVEAVGDQASHFRVGDHVYFAGSVIRSGTFAEYTLVDERIVGRKPNKLNWDEAATVPLVALTVWEGITEQLGVAVPANDAERAANSNKSFLIVGGAGGVGSFCVQVAKKVFGFKVIATASREVTSQYCQSLGADVIIDHTKPFKPQLQEKAGIQGVEYVYNTAEVEKNWDQICSVLKPFSKIVSILPSPNLNTAPLFGLRATLTFELMFTRPIHNVEQEKQGQILNTVAELLDKSVLRHTLNRRFDFSRENLVAALNEQHSGSAIGKIALTVYKP